MRVLMGLIASQGLITGAKGAELERLAKWAYRAYRAERSTPTRGLVTPLRWHSRRLLRTGSVRASRRIRMPGDITAPVAFVGLWDTVDAVRPAIDEMTRGWDQWVWPLSLRDITPARASTRCAMRSRSTTSGTRFIRCCSTSAKRARRLTPTRRVTQVWFSGVHSNVGGGYPDDSLAHVSLRWMADEACKKGLGFTRTSGTNGRRGPIQTDRLYDSRRGLGATTATTRAAS